MKLLLIIFITVLTDFYYFPIETVFLPGVNSKMILAAAGLGLVVMNTVKGQTGFINWHFLKLTLWALAISLVSLIAITFNNTNDPSFTTYFISMWVWLAGAYAVLCCMKWVHGYLSVELVCNYLILVCVSQCFIAILLDSVPSLNKTISSYLTGEKFMGGEDLGTRLHGIACALDVAAIRFSAVLLMIAYWVVKKRRELTPWQSFLYISSFLLIAVVGNMIGRTVTVGVLLALAYWIFNVLRGSFSALVTRQLGGVLLLSVPLLFIGYQTNTNLRKHLRFGFEGFFSLYEKGYWETNSNNILKNMVVFPDNAKTWMIGDGYAANPGDKKSPYFDPYYTGKNFHGYYMQTDIGYLRYIYYFGLIGLVTFMCYFIVAGGICMSNLNRHKHLFLLLLLFNFTVWLKVSTDIFVVFALFLCISKEEEDEAEQKELAAVQESF